MSASQTTVANKDATKSKANAVSLIKDPQYFALPVWLQQFIHSLTLLRDYNRPSLIYSRQDFLEGFINSLGLSGVINSSEAERLTELVKNASQYALADFQKTKEAA